MAGSDRRGDHHAVDGAGAARLGHYEAYNLYCCVTNCQCLVACHQRTPRVVTCGPLGGLESWVVDVGGYLCLQLDLVVQELEDELG